MPDEGDEIALATGFDPQHAKAVVGVMERDAVDQARQDLRRAHRRYLRHSRDDGCGAGGTPELPFLICLKPVSRMDTDAVPGLDGERGRGRVQGKRWEGTMPKTPWDRRELLKTISAGAVTGFLVGG